MKRKLLLSFTAVLYAVVAFSQPKKIIVKDGTWALTQYASNVIKISFQPKKYFTNENISDAVIEKPQSAITIPYKIKGNAIYIGEQQKIKIAEPVKDSAFYSFDITLNNSEKIFGGGERALPLNRRGY